MHTDTALLFGETSAVNFGSANWTGTCDGALSGHNKNKLDSDLASDKREGQDFLDRLPLDAQYFGLFCDE